MKEADKMNKNNFVKKGLVFGIIVLFVGASIIPSTIGINEEKTSFMDFNPRGTTWYVDDDNTEGPWDGSQEHPFQYIQDGVDASSDDDTVFVYNGTYNEHNIIINKSINLIGENKETTYIIDNTTDIGIHVLASGVTITGFTLAQYIEIQEGIRITGVNDVLLFGNIFLDCPIDCVFSGNITIIDNIIGYNTNQSFGLININYVDTVLMQNNTFQNIEDCIGLGDVTNAYVNENHFIDCMIGVGVSNSDNIIISNNSMQNCSQSAMYFGGYSNQNVTITNNMICDGFDAIQIFRSKNLNITNNTIRNNNRYAVYGESLQNIVIAKNTLIDNSGGILVLGNSSELLVLKHNLIVANQSSGQGIFIHGKNVEINGNYVEGWERGIYLGHNTINGNLSFNTITKNIVGVILYFCINITLYMNNITGNTVGIEIWDPDLNLSMCNIIDNIPTVVKHNNFKRNRFHMISKYKNTYRSTQLEQNFWGRSRILPKLIVVLKMITERIGIPSKIQIDWHPARKPYSIPRVSL